LKGDVNIRIMLLILVGLLTAALVIPGVSTALDDFESSSNASANKTSSGVDNVSCTRKCLDDNPSKGPGYYQCMENTGCN
jgi:hypothetical protein